MTLSTGAAQEAIWWYTTLPVSYSFIHPPIISHYLYTDASLAGWGATYSQVNAGGAWDEEEPPAHINVLELLAAYLALQSLCKHCVDSHVCLYMDNSTAVSHINKKGGTHSVLCDALAVEIWQWAIPQNIWLSAAFIPGESNVVADFYSWCPNNNTEWQLNPTVFERLCEVVDLFASAINKQTPQYVSWKPDPLAWAIDAFTISWKNLNFYAFPPFSIVPRVLQKLQQDQATGICILPNWPTHPWFPVMLQLHISHPYRASPHKRLLTLPCSTRNTSSPQEAGPFGAAFVRGSLADLAVPEATKTLIQDSWRASTRSQYDSVMGLWCSG